ncbi:MAG: family 4 glycosyl hydrolase [Georgenia sp.]
MNVSNAGLIEGLPETFTAEVSAVVDGDGIRPQAVGALPLQLAAVNAAFVSVGLLTVAAAVQGERRLPATGGDGGRKHVSESHRRADRDQCNAMVEAHGELLPPALRVQISA